MIPLSAIELPNSTWQEQLRDGFSRADELLRYLRLPVALASRDAEQLFTTRVPKSFANRMHKGNANDPLLKQVLALAAETHVKPNFINDPVGDLNALSHKGLIHKYHGRVLIITTGACAVNCRYCFRRNFPYSDNALSPADVDAVISSIAQDPSISEVILSGGDPLLLTDKKIGQWLSRIEAISHVKRLRIHSRLPIVIPSRITPELCQMLAHTRLACSLVLHTNHANELNQDVAEACSALRSHNVTLLNQTVLLKGINDSVSAMAALSESLFDYGVLPYYIHLLDKAAGVAHFDVPESQATQIHIGLKHQLPGYLVPKLVREIAGETSKVWISNR